MAAAAVAMSLDPLRFMVVGCSPADEWQRRRRLYKVWRGAAQRKLQSLASCFERLVWSCWLHEILVEIFWDPRGSVVVQSSVVVVVRCIH